jgi:hypothetical protein
MVFNRLEQKLRILLTQTVLFLDFFFNPVKAIAFSMVFDGIRNFGLWPDDDQYESIEL